MKTPEEIYYDEAFDLSHPSKQGYIKAIQRIQQDAQPTEEELEGVVQTIVYRLKTEPHIIYSPIIRDVLKNFFSKRRTQQ